MDAKIRFEKVRAAIERLNPAVHACVFYDGRDEEVAMVASYVRVGLERRELCVCIVDDGRERILDALSSEGVDAQAQLREGRLVFFEKQLARHLTTLDMLGKIEEWTEGARRAGHAGCRITGEMTWALDGGGSLKQLAEFEAQLNLNQVYERHACIGLCQFDVRRFTPELLREMIMLHPFVVVGDRVCRNPYHVPPERYLSPDWPLHETDWMLTNLEQLQLAQDGLQASEQSYRALARRMVGLQEQERRDIARELHDRVGQTLTAMRIDMDMIRTRLAEHDDPAIRRRNDDSLELIDSVFKAVENLMYDLRPPMLDEYGLVAPLKWYAEKFTDRTGIRVLVRGDESRRCPPGIELALFRIAQEALNNVARHSRARNVAIEFQAVGAHVLLTIEDDGVGFDFEAGRTELAGYGLITMRERAEAVGGTFEAHSVKGKGARIRVEVPSAP
jgi:signal transduction histidine kinase